mmetsp:Transcript_120041/g.212174  ORF Transcript_120041/g.212174 Transcript_120041/m.212174 type:complete len:211 (+) Transcript_120041:292-924(+)
MKTLATKSNANITTPTAARRTRALYVTSLKSTGQSAAFSSPSFRTASSQKLLKRWKQASASSSGWPSLPKSSAHTLSLSRLLPKRRIHRVAQLIDNQLHRPCFQAASSKRVSSVVKAEFFSALEVIGREMAKIRFTNKMLHQVAHKTTMQHARVFGGPMEPSLFTKAATALASPLGNSGRLGNSLSSREILLPPIWRSEAGDSQAKGQGF